MRNRTLTKWLLTATMLLTLPLSQSLCQDAQPADAFDIEPPLLVSPSDVENAGNGAEAQPNVSQLEKELERARKSAALAEREVKIGVLAKVEAEQRALRVDRLEAELAKARLRSAQAEAAAQQARNDASPASKAELDAATTAVAQATAAAQTAENNYRKAQLDAAELNLRRQRRLLAVGSARKSDVARAEEKLATLQRNTQTLP